MTNPSPREGYSTRDPEKANITSAMYLEPIRNRLQKPIEGLPALAVLSTKKREGKGTEKTIGAYLKSSTYV